MDKKPLFPMFVSLAGERCLLVGGGTVALRKAEKLLPYGPRLTVVAPEIAPELAALPGVTLCRRAFEMDDLTGQMLVIAATDVAAQNHAISAECRARNIPVNVVDDPAECSFLFPALVRRGPLSVGISTGGASPTAAIDIKKKIDALLPEQLDEILRWLEEKRPAVKAAYAEETERAAVFAALYHACMAAGRPLTEDEFATRLAKNRIKETRKPGCVYLVGAGCGAADFITVRGEKLLRQCDAVVYDDLIDAALLALAPATAKRIPVGKRGGRASTPQQQINQILIQLAQEGLTVVRLKGGDPFVFGRGGEEMEALQAADIPCAEVPGISSAIAIPAAAGIPVTHRGVSRGFHVITAHTAEEGDTLLPQLETLAKLDGTLVFLMGLGKLNRLTAALIDGGRSADTPAAVVSGGNAPNPCTVRGTLADLAQKAAAAGVQAPAVIVVGEVAALDFSPTIGEDVPQHENESTDAKSEQ